VARYLYNLGWPPGNINERDAFRLGEMLDLIQREHAGTWQAARAAHFRAELERGSALKQAATRADSMAADHSYRDKLRQVITMPGASSSVLTSAYLNLFYNLEQDSTSSADELVAVLERTEEHSRDMWYALRVIRHIRLPVALAERGSRLDLAEQLARDGLEPMEDYFESVQHLNTVASYAESLDRAKSGYHATLGWVLFHKGDITEAKRELQTAHEARITDPTPPYRLGRIAEAEGDVEQAERWYATGRGGEFWNRHSSEALQRLYQARNESLDGFEEYLAAIDERDMAHRRAKVESDRISEPEPLPDFEHGWMNSGRFSSESLKGKVAVINFWGVWCGPCVRETPEIQAFAEKFRDHPDVVFITVANDQDPATTRAFMEEKGYDFPVILDEGLVSVADIRAFPTTLFVDRAGRVLFKYVAASLRLVEEYTWRVEALLGRTVADDAPLSAAAAQLLRLLDLRVDDEAVELGARLTQEHPDDAALHALQALALIQYYHRAGEGVQLGIRIAERWPDDAWVQVAHGTALARGGRSFRDRMRTESGLAAAARARQLAPYDAHIARRVMDIYSLVNRRQQAVALADTFISSGRGTAGIRVARAIALWDMAEFGGRPDTAAARVAQQELARALAVMPPSAAALYTAALRTRRDRRHADALALAERAMELSPHSGAIRHEYWVGISGADLPAAERQAIMHADMDAFLDARQHAVGARLLVAGYAVAAGDERLDAMVDVIQREHPGTWEAAKVAFDRALWVRFAAEDKATDGQASIAANRRSSEMLRSVIGMPGASRDVLGDAYAWLFSALVQDSATSAEELVTVFERLEEHSTLPSYRMRHVSLPVALAERGSRLDYAEELARAGSRLVDDVEWLAEYSDVTVEQYANMLDQATSEYHATLGWVMFHKGDLDSARRELELAHEVLNTATTPLYRLGRIAEAEADIEAAERWYAAARGREDRARRSTKALERIYLSRNASLDGFDGYLAAIDERDVARRRAKVEAERITEPEPLPAFEHDWMNGDRFSSESLAGKVAVINFWGVWCGSCVREAPDIQKFAEKFRHHPDVVFITVANDSDPDTTRDFMEEKGYGFPVILDDGLGRAAKIQVYPTTLFVDREGHVLFRYVGSSVWLVEEYTWRVEALLGRTVAGERLH
jgi:thiol-disulfide isomerase/thioredoxin